MPLTTTHRRKLASALINLTRSARYISSVKHLTPAEIRLFFRHFESKSRLPRQPIPQKSPCLQFLRPQIYHPESSTWIAFEPDDHINHLQRGSVLKVVSWNIDAFSFCPGIRTSSALGHLQEVFGTVPGHLVVMLQEVCHESLQAILESSWVQRNFVLTNVDPPQSLYKEISGGSFILRDLYWKAELYFTLIMIPKDLGIVNCFRVPFVTQMGRDALFVDLPISTSGRRTKSNESLRLCTTHLESLWSGKAYRPSQLAMISAFLKGPRAAESRIIAGLVGGDMNAIDRSEHTLHQVSDINLKDVWEDIPAPPVPVLKPFKKDTSYGRAKGNTWGYQSKSKAGERKRMDKFFYTGLMETVALTEPQDVTGRLGRVGISLKTEVEAWEGETTEWNFVRGKTVLKSYKELYSHERVRRLNSMQIAKPNLLLRKIDYWVSDHFGIVVGIKVA